MSKKKVWIPAPNEDVGTLIHAGQDFVAGHAWITVPLKGKCEDETEIVTFYLNDAGEIYHANQVVDGLRMVDVPKPDERWELNDLRSWLNGGKNSSTLKELVEQVAALYSKYAEYVHPFEPKFFALWSIATYFYQLFDNFPIVFLTGLKGTGKSRTGKVTAFTAFNGHLSPNISPAALFRDIDEKKGTVIIDEKESLGEVSKEVKDKDMESVLNGGDKKGATVERCELDLATKKMMSRKFEIYSPKMICNVCGGLSSDTVMNRCITVIMQRAMHDVTIDEPDERSNDFVSIRCSLYRYMMAHWKDVQRVYIDSDFKGNKRAVTIWKPLVVMAGMVDEDLKKELLDYMEASVLEAEVDEGETDEVKLLFRLYDVVTEKKYYTLKEIRGMDETDLRWLDYNERRHGHMMKKLGFRNKKHTNKGAAYLLSPERILFELKRVGLGIPQKDDDLGRGGGGFRPSPTSATSQTSLKGDNDDVNDNGDGQNRPPDVDSSSLRPPSQSSLGNVMSDNNGSPEQFVEVQTDKPEPSRWLPEKEWNEVGKCSSCGVNNQTTMVGEKQLCKLCYFELKSDELNKGEGDINPSNENQKEGS